MWAFLARVVAVAAYWLDSEAQVWVCVGLCGRHLGGMSSMVLSRVGKVCEANSQEQNGRKARYCRVGQARRYRGL